jgi:hypothetical protein
MNEYLGVDWCIMLKWILNITTTALHGKSNQPDLDPSEFTFYLVSARKLVSQHLLKLKKTWRILWVICVPSFDLMHTKL